jgi:hypothetical protein
MITCILGHSSNESFNMFQCLIGFFCISKCTPEVICKMLAHMGILASLSTTRNTVKSLQTHENACLKSLPPVNMIYDNFNMDFKVAQPITGRQGLHMSATAATFAPYVDISLDDLHFTKELYATSRFNINLQPDNLIIYRPSASDLIPKDLIQASTLAASRLDSVNRAFTWHMWAILMERAGIRGISSSTGFARGCIHITCAEDREIPCKCNQH